MNATQPDVNLLIGAVIASNWSVDHPLLAVQAIQRTVRNHLVIEWTEDRALQELWRLLDELKLIAVRADRPAINMAETGQAGPPIKAKYFKSSPE